MICLEVIAEKRELESSSALERTVAGTTVAAETSKKWNDVFLEVRDLVCVLAREPLAEWLQSFSGVFCRAGFCFCRLGTDSRKRSGSCDHESAEQVQDSSRQIFVAVENHWLGYQEGFVRIDLAGGAVLLFRS